MPGTEIAGQYPHSHKVIIGNQVRFVLIVALSLGCLLVPSSVIAGIEDQVQYAKRWYMGQVRPTCGLPGECDGMRGDANCSGGYPDLPTIGDISAMVDAKFIANTCGPKPGKTVPIICNLDEADVNVSAPPNAGTMCSDITIGNISTLIDYLFITGPFGWDEGYGWFPTGEGKLPPCP